MNNEELVIEKLRSLPPELLSEVLDFIEFLEQRSKEKKWIEFDEWAINLAREKGFNHLTEEDVAETVKAYRREG